MSLNFEAVSLIVSDKYHSLGRISCFPIPLTIMHWAFYDVMAAFTCMLFTSLSILRFSYVSSQESTPAQSPLMMKLMTFNIRTDQAPKDADEHCTQWNEIRKDGVVQQIASQNPDFFGVQETSDAQKGFLDQQLSTYAAVGASSGSLNGNPAEWNAIYHKKDTWAPIASGMFWLVRSIRQINMLVLSFSKRCCLYRVLIQMWLLLTGA